LAEIEVQSRGSAWWFAKALPRNARLRDGCEMLPTVRRSLDGSSCRSCRFSGSENRGGPAGRATGCRNRLEQSTSFARSFREPDHNWTLYCRNIRSHPEHWPNARDRSFWPVPAYPQDARFGGDSGKCWFWKQASREFCCAIMSPRP